MFNLGKLQFDSSPDITFDPPASDKMIAQLEEHYGHTLPEGLKAIFKRYHGGCPDTDLLEVSFPDDDFIYEMEVSRFLFLDSNLKDTLNIWFLIKHFSEFIGSNSVPFAEDYASHLYYLKYNNNQNEVWYLAHQEVDETETYKVCETFEQFLNSMYSEEN